jgi:rod shape determining protein RodA
MMHNQFMKRVHLFKRTCWPITFAVCLLLIIGVLFIYSACYISEGLEVQSYYKKQILWAFVGLLSYIFFSLFDYRRFRRIAVWLYAVCLVLLVMVLMFGVTRYGATRWLMILGVNVQPSELMKIGVLILLARIFSTPSVNMKDLRVFLFSLFIVFVPFALIKMQPDLGTAIILFPVTFVMMFVGGVPLRYLGVIVALGVACVALLLGLLVLPEKMGASEERQAAILNTIGLKDHQKRRILVFLNLDKDPLGSGWNKKQSKIAVGSGGAWGKGYCKGKQNILGFLPRSVAPTDFIYSVIAEEKGFMGSVIVLLLYGTIIGFGMLGAIIARDRMGRLLCAGVVTMLFTHVFVNIAMTVGLMPITGLPLPLLSYGGTFMVVVMSSLGIVQSVFVRSRRSDNFAHSSSKPIGYSGGIRKGMRHV